MTRYYSNSYYYHDDELYPWKETVSSIYALRREGNLDEALSMSRSAHEQYPEEDDVTKVYGWTLYSMCEQATELWQIELARELFENEYKSLSFK